MNKKTVKTLLKKMSQIDPQKLEAGLTPERKIDPRKYSRIPQVKTAITKLAAMGVTRKWLSDNGFMTAAMVLDFTAASET